MTPANFKEANSKFTPPPGFDESQVATVPAYIGQVNGGSVDGCSMAVVAWLPSPDELSDILAGKPIFLTVLGGLPPHFLSTSFQSATRPA
jgi:hypothetical protein